MPREVQIVQWCDVCWLEDETQVRAVSTWTLSARTGEVDRPVPKVLDTCEPHGKPFADLAAMLEAVGTLPPASRAKPATPPPAALTGQMSRTECPVCGDPLAKGAIVGHVWSQHREPGTRPAAPTTCPDCGDRFTTPQGCGAHRTATHRYDALVDALSGARK